MDVGFLSDSSFCSAAHVQFPSSLTNFDQRLLFYKSLFPVGKVLFLSWWLLTLQSHLGSSNRVEERAVISFLLSRIRSQGSHLACTANVSRSIIPSRTLSYRLRQFPSRGRGVAVQLGEHGHLDSPFRLCWQEWQWAIHPAHTYLHSELSSYC